MTLPMPIPLSLDADIPAFTIALEGSPQIYFKTEHDKLRWLLHPNALNPQLHGVRLLVASPTEWDWFELEAAIQKVSRQVPAHVHPSPARPQ